MKLEELGIMLDETVLFREQELIDMYCSHGVTLEELKETVKPKRLVVIEWLIDERMKKILGEIYEIKKHRA